MPATQVEAAQHRRMQKRLRWACEHYHDTVDALTRPPHQAQHMSAGTSENAILNCWL